MFIIALSRGTNGLSDGQRPIHRGRDCIETYDASYPVPAEYVWERMRHGAITQQAVAAIAALPFPDSRRTATSRKIGAFVVERRMYRRNILLASAVLPFLVGCHSVDVQQTTTMHGVVETVDPASRELLLRGDGGSQSGILMSMVVGPQVQRLGEIRPGDHVVATYYQALAAQMVNVFSPSSPPFEGISVDRRDTAERPGGLVTRVRRGRVVITAVYPSIATVSFVGPNNMVRTVTAKNPQVQSFIRGLKVGDQVDVVYEEALAISVQPVAA